MTKTEKRTLIPSKINFNPKTNAYLRIFLMCFLSCMVIFIPVIIFNNGYFIYYGDFNSQQLMFYKHCNEAIKNGVMWDWGTDLGSDFIGAYSFYTLGSPFFWLSVLFPAKIAPMLVPWLIAIKTGVAGMTSFAFIKRFVKTENAAVIGALLYAMSGFQTYNIFFNHFHDVTALFPLLLVALEERMQNDRKGVFALAVALMATVNYFFFTGQVTFLVIYFIIRWVSKGYKVTLKKFISLAIESVLGVGLACALLLPSVLLVLTNTRVDSRLYGLDMVTYSDKTRLLRIIQSFFMLPDPPARSNLFAQSTARWASIAGYLPLYSMIGVISFMRVKKGHWATRIFWVCAFFAAIPILNTSFYMFNSSYYARWFYMPVLIMAFMTAYAIDNNEVGLKKGFLPSLLVPVFFTVISCLPKKVDDKVEYMSMAQYPDLFTIQLLITFGCLFFALYLIMSRENSRKYLKKLVASTVAGCFICTATIVYYGVAQGPLPHEYVDYAIGGDEIELNDDSFYRIDVSSSSDNWPMHWGDYSNIRTFQSVVNGSIMEFYPFIGIERNVATRPETDIYQLRGLTSTKYYFDFVKEDEGRQELEMEGFEFIGSQNGFDIYENVNYVPMGYVYDMYFDTDTYEEYSNRIRQDLLMAAVYLPTELVEKYSDIMTCFEDTVNSTATHMTYDGYAADCEKAAAQSCYFFETNGKGFVSKIRLEKESLVFYSVPYSEGFTAYINGQEAEIDKVYNGLCAVRVPAGDNTIEFKYQTPGLKAGIIISIISGALLFIYIIVWNKLVKRDEKAEPEYDYEPVWDTIPETEDEESAEENDGGNQNEG